MPVWKPFEENLFLAEELVIWAASLAFPKDEQDFICVALKHLKECPMNEGKIASDSRLDPCLSCSTYFLKIRVDRTKC